MIKAYEYKFADVHKKLGSICEDAGRVKEGIYICSPLASPELSVS